MIDETGCDAIMIGRATLGKPWLIKRCVEYLDDGTLPKKVTKEERLEMIKRHTELLFERKPEKVAISRMRLHTAYYLKGLYRSGEIKPKIFKTTTKEELYDLVENYMEILNY